LTTARAVQISKYGQMTTAGRAEFDHIWVFVLRAPSSSDVPVLLLNQPITRVTTGSRTVRSNPKKSKDGIITLDLYLNGKIKKTSLLPRVWLGLNSRRLLLAQDSASSSLLRFT